MWHREVPDICISRSIDRNPSVALGSRRRKLPGVGLHHLVFGRARYPCQRRGHRRPIRARNYQRLRDGTFGPDNSVTRQQFAKMIVKTLGLAVTGSEICPFIDVDTTPNPTDPYYPLPSPTNICSGNEPDLLGCISFIQKCNIYCNDSEQPRKRPRRSLRSRDRRASANFSQKSAMSHAFLTPIRKEARHHASAYSAVSANLYAFLPAAFTSYMARSASLIKSSASLPSFGKRAMPTLALTTGC